MSHLGPLPYILIFLAAAVLCWYVSQAVDDEVPYDDF